MSLYVRIETSFYSHRKTLRLRAVIGNDAFWVPPRLWAYAAGNQPDGDFSDYTADEIACLIGYEGHAKRMLQALLAVKFMDASPLRIHDWIEFNGVLGFFADRAKKAAQARWTKQKERERTKEKGVQIRSDQIRSEPSIAPSIATSIATSMKIKGASDAQFAALQMVKSEINTLFRQPQRIWKEPEERQLGALSTRPEFLAEWSTIKGWHGRLEDKAFFPHSVFSLLDRWPAHLDSAHTYSPKLSAEVLKKQQQTKEFVRAMMS